MNREIKFRVYIPKTKTMHYMNSNNQPLTEIDFIRKKISILKERGETIDKNIVETYNFEDVKIMQYIGIRNNHLQDIYEGDLFYDEGLDEYGYIAYDNAEIILNYSTFTQRTDNDELTILYVIGDLYTIKDNYPELLLGLY